MQLKCVSINIQGIKQHWKRLYLNKLIADLNIDVLFIQETHIPSGARNPWKLWSGEYCIIEGRADKSSQGTALLIKSALQPSNINILLSNSRLIIVQLHIMSTPVVLINLYNALAFRANEFHLNRIFQQLSSLPNHDNVIFMGDFNRQQYTLNKWTHLFSSRLGVVDVTTAAGVHTQHTHITPAARTTIDYCWISQNLLLDATMSYMPNALSDHVALCSTLQLQTVTMVCTKATHSFYFPHPALPTTIDFINDIYIATAPLLMANDVGINDWNTCKQKISRLVLSANRAFNVRNAMHREFHKLMTTAENQAHVLQPDAILRLKSQFREIEKIDELKARYMLGKQIKMAGQDLLPLLKTPLFRSLKTPNYINALRVGDAVVTQVEMAAALSEYLQDLFGSRALLQFPVPRLELSLSSHASNLSALLNSYFNIQTVTQAIQSLNHHAPSGPSAITVPFLKRFSYIFPTILTHLFKTWMVAGFQARLGMKIGSFLICFDKRKKEDGENRGVRCPEPAGLGDVRPITLEDTEAKVFAKIMYTILIDLYRDRLHPSQFCLVGRSIHDALRLLCDANIAYKTCRRQAPVVLFVDIAKAFDNVDHDYLIDKIYTDTENPLLCRGVRNYLGHKYTALKWRNRVFKEFQCFKGVSQGSPVSSLLFAIYLDELLHLIDGSIPGIFIPSLGRNLRSLAYADDLVVFCNDLEEVDIILDLIEDVGARSGMQINRSKTATYHLPDFSPVPEFSVARIDKFLGLPMPLFTHEARIKTQNKIIHSFKSITFSLSNSKLTLKTKVKVVNMFCIPKINYFAPHMKFPQSFIAALNALITKFLWVKRKCVVSRRAMYFSYKLGGLSLIDIGLFATVLRVNAFIAWARYLDLNTNIEITPTDRPPPWVSKSIFGSLQVSWRNLIDDFPTLQGHQKIKYKVVRELKYPPEQTDIKTVTLARISLMMEKTLVPANIVDFTYKTIHFKLPTNLLLTKMGILSIPVECPMCSLHPESIDHLLCVCTDFDGVRRWMATDLEIDLTPFKNVFDLLCAFVDRQNKLRIVLVVLFLFWKVRCFLTFNHIKIRKITYISSELKQLFTKDRQICGRDIDRWWPFTFPVPQKWKFLL